MTGGAAPAFSIPELFLALAAILITAKLLGELAERIGQPSVLGELLGGVLLGSVLGVIPTSGPAADVIHLFAELGVLLLLFEIGLDTDLRAMFRVGPAALSVAMVGVALPFALGFAYWAYVAHPASATANELTTAAIFIGATMTATSVGITARVLSDLNQMHTAEARIILGAAIIDDVLGLVILTLVSRVVEGATVSAVGTLRILGVAVGFLVVAVLLGRYLAPRIFDLIVRMRVRYVLLVFAVAFALALAGLAAVAGSALIVGAFAAGLILSGTNQLDTIKREVRPVASVFTPIFFVSVGASLNLGILSGEGAGDVLVIAAILTVIALVGKLVAGWAAPWLPFRRAVVGIGMVPRGEVGLIFADIGRRSGVLNDTVFGAVLLMVMATTLLGPLALKVVFPKVVATDNQPSLSKPA